MGETASRPAILLEEGVGLFAAVILHALILAVLALQFLFAAPEPPASNRMTVSLATEVSLESTAPNPAPESRAAIAPTLGENPLPEADAPVPEARPEAPVTPPQARTPPRTQPRTPPRTRTPPRDRSRDRSRPDRTPAPTPTRSASNAGGGRIGDNFLEGQGSSTQSDNTTAPAATFGRRERAALGSAITRQLRPHWNAPSGVDAEKLISTVSWQLNQDGSLKRTPTCQTKASSVTDSNRPQARLHCERAIRAVQLAAPFNLPEQFYSRWDDLEWQFDRRL